MTKHNYTTTHYNLSTYKLSVQKVKVWDKLEVEVYKILDSKGFCHENGSIMVLRNSGTYTTTRRHI